MAQVSDIAVLGATPAGVAAAGYLAASGHSVVLIDTPNDDVECSLCDWVGRGFFATAGLAKTLAKQSGAVPFKNVSYHSADLTKRADYTSRGAIGYFIEPAKLIDTLKGQAKRAGVKIRKARGRTEITLAEHHVCLGGPTETRAQVLLIARGSPSDVLAELSLPIRTGPVSSLLVAGLDVPLDDGDWPDAPPGALHVVESAERNELGMFLVMGSTLHLRIISASAAAGTRAAELSALVSDLQRADLVPRNLRMGQARGAVWRPPAGAALEMESQVAKRCLLIGTAGGFAEAVTGQTLTASVRSALLAADVAAEALRHDDCQESLMQFKDSWRGPLADFIRPPNTSLQMLLPLMFVNKQIVSRFTAALLQGENM